MQCTRCATTLSYAGRPCPWCLSPALYRVRDGALLGTAGSPRATALVKIRVPRRQRTVAALALVGRWTWNSLLIAAALHFAVFGMLWLLRHEIIQPIEHVHLVAFDETAAAVITAPEPMEPLAANLESPDDELQLPRVEHQTEVEAGEPEFEPPEPMPYAPEPEVAPPQPAVMLPQRSLPAEAAPGQGSGQPQPSAKPAPSGSGLLQNRQGESRTAAVKRYGGGEDTENAVNLGLEYLARKQSRDGSWEPSAGFAHSRGFQDRDNAYRGALTALCTLPFLAAGHSPETGRYAANVKRAVNWLLKQQTADGCVAANNFMQMYTHTVATLALCEAYGMTDDRRLRSAAEKAVRYLERTQGVGGGWDYNAQVSATHRGPERNDLSISGWGVLALKSARAVGLKVSDTTWQQLAELYHKQSTPEGWTYYADRAHGQLPGGRTGIGMVGVGLVSRQTLDADRFTTRNAAAEGLLLAYPPQWKDLLRPTQSSVEPNFTTFYGWYYGTLGMFLKNQGQGAAWESWNTALKEALLPNQVTEGDRKGSWPAADTWIGPVMGDLYSTACAVLCLEVYYRYNPMHQTEADRPRAPSVLRGRPEAPVTRQRPVEIGGEQLDLALPGDRARYLRLIARDQGLGATGLLIDHLRDESATVRVTAVHQLARLKPADAIEPLCAMLGRSENRDLRGTICDALGRMGHKSAAQPLIRLLADGDTGTVSAAQAALSRLSDGRDFGTNRHAWAQHFGVNP